MWAYRGLVGGGWRAYLMAEDEEAPDEPVAVAVYRAECASDEFGE